MLTLNNIRRNPGANRKTKRLGRGPGSGQGTRAGKGDKGQLARSGGGKPGIGFEGGQTPLYRRLPKQGFKNVNRRPTAILNVKDLERLDPAQFDVVSLESLQKARIVRGRYDRLAVLGDGEISKSFKVKAYRITPQAEKKISAAGGSIEKVVYPTPKPGEKPVKRERNK